jgi:hypothetical protein
MKKYIVITLFLFALGNEIVAQSLVADKGTVTFFSSAPLEDITAVNENVSCLFDLSNKNIAFSIPIAQFKFKKSLMQEHFNEKYMESEKFPKATFQGTLEGLQDVGGVQQVKALGKLTIHGVTRDVAIDGYLERAKEGGARLKSIFLVKLEDYNIVRPQILWQNIAEQVEVTLDLKLKSK